MAQQIVYYYLPDALTDSEMSFLLSELHTGRYFKKGVQGFLVQTVASTKEAVVSQGGITMLPDLSLEEVELEKAALLLLPGADTWAHPKHSDLPYLVRQFLYTGLPVGAICGATTLLAQAGILDTYTHTSNSLDYLKMNALNYKGEANYVEKLVVTDKGLTTGTGLAPLEFAFEVLGQLDVMDRHILETWYHLYRDKDPAHIFKLFDYVENREKSGFA